MQRKDAVEYVSFVVDDALSAREINPSEVLPSDRLVGWQCGFEPLFVAVRSYLPDTRIDADEAVELATEYLEEKGWFDGSSRDHEPDYIF
jgi:hypothetical protein